MPNQRDTGEEYRKNRVFLPMISLAYIAVFANIQGFQALLPLVQAEFTLSRAQAGLYTSFYFLSGALIAIFSGKIVDGLGTRRGLILGVGILGFMMILHALSPLFGLILLFAFITGFAFSVITPSVNKGVLELSEPSRRSTNMGMVHGLGGLGGFLGAFILPFAGELVGWRMALVFSSMLALGVAAFLARFFRPVTARPVWSEASMTDLISSLRKDLAGIMSDRYLLWVCAMGIVFGISVSSVSGHYAIFLNRDLLFSPTAAGLGLGIFQIGGMLGQPFWGYANQRWMGADRRRGLYTLGFVIAALCLFFGLVVSRGLFSLAGILVVSFLLGFCIIGLVAVYFTAIGELAPPGRIGIVTGLALTYARLSMVVAPPLFGLVADRTTGTYTLSWVLLGGAVFGMTLAFWLFGKPDASRQHMRS